MANQLLKITTSNGEQRWINLNRLTRVTVVEKDHEPLMTFCFDGDDRVVIHGTDEASCDLIRRIVATLDGMAEASDLTLAA